MGESLTKDHAVFLLAFYLYVLPAAYAQLQAIASAHNMLILADAAQSFGGSQSGAKVGSLADMTATSFYPSKNTQWLW